MEGAHSFFFLEEIFLQRKIGRNTMAFQMQISRSKMVFHSTWKTQLRGILKVMGNLPSFFLSFPCSWLAREVILANL